MLLRGPGTEIKAVCDSRPARSLGEYSADGVFKEITRATSRLTGGWGNTLLLFGFLRPGWLAVTVNFAR
jgi:hypothetical protein